MIALADLRRAAYPVKGDEKPLRAFMQFNDGNSSKPGAQFDEIDDAVVGKA